MDRWLPLPKGGGVPPQSDGAFERFLTAAIATIITIMFSWRLLDKLDEDETAETMSDDEKYRRQFLAAAAASSNSGSSSSPRRQLPAIPTEQQRQRDYVGPNVPGMATTTTTSRSRSSTGGVSFQLTTLKPIIRVPVDLPLDGDDEASSPDAEPIYRPTWENTVLSRPLSDRAENSPSPGIDHRYAGVHTASTQQTDTADRYFASKTEQTGAYTSTESLTASDGRASSTETLLASASTSQQNLASPNQEADPPVDSSVEDVGDGHGDLLLNISTDSSSGGANSSKEEYRHILDDDNYHPYRDRYHGSDRTPDRSSDDEFIDGTDFDYRDDNDYGHGYDDIQPRELDSDEELFCCSTLEPIMEEDSDEMTTSSESTNSSRSGKGFYDSKSRGGRDYDLDYEERKRGLFPERELAGDRSNGRGRGRHHETSDARSVTTPAHGGLSRPSTARRPASHLPGRTREPEILHETPLTVVNTGVASGPDSRALTGSGDDYFVHKVDSLAGIDISTGPARAISDFLYFETDLDASEPEDGSNFLSEEDYVKYIRSYGSSVDRLSLLAGNSDKPAESDRINSDASRSNARVSDARVTRASDQIVPNQFVQTFSSRVEIEDSTSESDESVQTVITRQPSADSGGSPVHLNVLRANPIKTKRPVSDGAAYANKKLKGEEEEKEAYFRERYVSEGGGVPFGEDGRGCGEEEESEESKRDLKAYKSYAALDSEGLGSPVRHRDSSDSCDGDTRTPTDSSSPGWDIPNTGDQDSLGCSRDPYKRRSPEERGDTHEQNNNDSVVSADADSRDVFRAGDDVDSVSGCVYPASDGAHSDSDLNKPKDFKFVYSQFSREDRSQPEGAGAMEGGEYYTRVETSGMDEGRESEGGNESEEWDNVIEETFVIPVSPERAILRTLQSVKDLLDRRSADRRHELVPLEVEEPMDDECQSSCTTTMIEVDGYGAAGFEGYEELTSGYMDERDAVARTGGSLKSKLGFQLNLDEFKTDDYNTESGWPIVRYIEKERVFVEENGEDSNQVLAGRTDESKEYRESEVNEDEEYETNIDDVEEEESEGDNDEEEEDDEESGEEEEESGEEEEFGEEEESEVDEVREGMDLEDRGHELHEDEAVQETPHVDEQFDYVVSNEDTFLHSPQSHQRPTPQTPSVVQAPVIDQRSPTQRTYSEERYTKLEYGDVKSPTLTLPPRKSETFKPTVRAEMRSLSPPPIEVFTPFQASGKLTVPTPVDTKFPSGEDTQQLPRQSISDPSFGNPPKTLIDSDAPYEPFDDFNTFLSGVPASSEPVIEEDYDEFVRHISEKDDTGDSLDHDVLLKTPHLASGILSGNLASPYTKQDVFMFPGKDSGKPASPVRSLTPRVADEERKAEKRSEDGDDAFLEEGQIKKPKLKRTSTAQSEDDFKVINAGGVRRSSLASQGDESGGVLNRSFEESSSHSFALERYDAEPAMFRSISRESLKRSNSRDGLESPTQDSQRRFFTSPRPGVGVSLEPALDVVLEAPVPPQETQRSESSSSAEQTTPVTPTAPAKLEPGPTVTPPSAKIESGPTVTPTPAKLKPGTPPVAKVDPASAVAPPVQWTRVIPGSNFVEEKLSPASNKSITDAVQKLPPDTPERKTVAVSFSKEIERPEMMDLEFADADDEGPDVCSPTFSTERLEIKFQASPKIRPIFENNALRFPTQDEIDGRKPGLSDESSVETEEEGSDETDDQTTDDEEEEEEEEEEEDNKKGEVELAIDSKKEEIVTKQKLFVTSNLEITDKNKNVTNSLDSIDDVFPQESTSTSEPTSPGLMSSDSTPVLESPVLTARSLPAPISIPFRGTAWAHSQFVPGTPPRPRSMKEIKKKFKPYKSVLTQQPSTAPTTPTSPKIAPFVLPDNLMTPSRLKIIHSRNRFLSEQNLNSDAFSGEFAARKGTPQQQQSAPAKERKYTPKSMSNSSKYRSQEQLEKIMSMINMTSKSSNALHRRSESSLHTAHLHEDCMFSEQGRRDLIDKALSIDNIHLDLYRQLQKFGEDADSRGMGDAFFPETNSDLFDLTFPFQDDRRQVLDRPASMSELRHASDYTTISGSGLYDTPNSKSAHKGRFASRAYKKSKSLCTLETNIDDHFATSPTDDNLQRVPSVHELRISKSLQKLNVPDWYKQSSLSKSGSCLLKYGSSSTMSSWQMSPSLLSSPCTTPSSSANVVIKSRVQLPTSARNLRSPRYPSKSAPTTPSFMNDSSESKPTTPTPVKLPSEQLRSKEKPKSLMPIPIVPFDRIRAMFEKKKESPSKPQKSESPVSPASPRSPVEGLMSPRQFPVNGKADEEDDFYEDVVPKVVVSQSDPHVKSILKRPGTEKRYSDIVESPESDEEPVIHRPLATRPVESAPTLTLPQSPSVKAPQAPSVKAPQAPSVIPPQAPVVRAPQPTAPAEEEKVVVRQKPVPPPRPKSSEIKPKPVEVPVADRKSLQLKDEQKLLKQKDEEKRDLTPTAKPRGFNFFKSLRSSSSSSSEDVKEKSRKSPASPSSPASNLSPDSSYEADRFPASPVTRLSPTRPPLAEKTSPPSITVTPEAAREPPASYSSPSLEREDFHRAEASPPLGKQPPVRVPPVGDDLPRRTKSPDSIQETNIDDSFEDAPNSPTRRQPDPVLVAERAQSPPRVPEPEKKRGWFPKSKSPKSPTESEKPAIKPKPKDSKVSELQSKFEVPQISYEPRRLTSSRSSSAHDESFQSDDSNRSLDRSRSPGSSLGSHPPVKDSDTRSSIKETDLDRSVDSYGSKSGNMSRDLGLDYSKVARKPSVDSDSSFVRDTSSLSDRREPETRGSGRGFDRTEPREPERGSLRDASFSSRDDDKRRSNRDYDRDYDRRDKDYDRRDKDYNRRDKDYDRDYDRRRGEDDRRDRDMDRRGKDYDRRERDDDRRDRDYDRRERDYGRREPDPRDRGVDKRRQDREWSPRDSTDSRREDTGRGSLSRDMDTSRESRASGRKPSDSDDAPKLRVGASKESLTSVGRTWQPKPRGSRSSVSPQARDEVPRSAKPMDSNGTPSKASPYRYPVPGSAFSASRPNTISGLNTPPSSRHEVKPPAASPESSKSLKETTV